MNYTYPPIIVFAFNRLDCLQYTIQSILQNEEAKYHDLFVFVDGPRKNKIGETEKVNRVQEYVRTIAGFRSISYTFSANNKGLAQSVISGVSQVINQYGKAIVLEDDLALAPNCLSYFHQALNQFENIKDVFSICGYTSQIRVPESYLSDTYFCTRSSSWGWATWADRWNSVDWELKDWDKVRMTRKGFCQWGGSDCWHMLNKWHEGKISSWAIRFSYSQFQQNKVSLFPIHSLIDNNGFDGNGTNCKRWSRFKFVLDKTGNKVFTWPETTAINPILYKEAMKYHTLWIRILSIVMYKFYDIKQKLK